MPDLVLTETTDDGITVLTMNNPRRLNGWTTEMLEALLRAMKKAAGDSLSLIHI